MGKGSTSAPAADPQIGAAALKQAEIAQQWLDFGKDQFAVGNERQKAMDELSTKLVDQQYGISQRQADWATQDRQRYTDKFIPIEDKFVSDAMNYATPEKQAEAAAEAKADVLNNAQAAQQANTRQMASMGVNPNSGRFQGVDRATDVATGLAAAGAQNNARNMVRDKGLALEADAANFGRGLPSQSAQATSVGIGAGQAAMGTSAAANQNFYQNNAQMGQAFQGGISGYGSSAQTLNNLYGNQINAWSAQQQSNATSSAGLMSGLGSLAGVGLMMMSSEEYKEDKEPVKGALEAVDSMPVEKWKYKEGVADEGEHVGPYAEDFKKATGLGDGKSIDVISAIGLGLKATQELNEKVEDLAKQVQGKQVGAKKPRKSQHRKAA